MIINEMEGNKGNKRTNPGNEHEGVVKLLVVVAFNLEQIPESNAAENTNHGKNSGVDFGEAAAAGGYLRAVGAYVNVLGGYAVKRGAAESTNFVGGVRETGAAGTAFHRFFHKYLLLNYNIQCANTPARTRAE